MKILALVLAFAVACHGISVKPSNSIPTSQLLRRKGVIRLATTLTDESKSPRVNGYNSRQGSALEQPNFEDNPVSKTHYILTGDIGGTNSRMSLYATSAKTDAADNPLVVKYYRNAEHLPLEGDETLSVPGIFERKILKPFLQYCWDEQTDVSLVPLANQVEIIACLALAGLVSHNRVSMTNLNGMIVDGNRIAGGSSSSSSSKHDGDDKYLHHIVKCKIVNDFVAQGYGCLTLQQHEVRQLAGPQNTQLADLTHGVKACVGAGTGLGECFLTTGQDEDDHDDAARSVRYTCYPSEGGHVEFAPRNDLEAELWEYLNVKYISGNRISVERIVSGKGLANVYDFLAHKYPNEVEAGIHDEFLQAGDEQGKIVAVNAREGNLCCRAIMIMMGAYGCEVGSAAIKWIPTGGLFVTGGLTPKTIKYIEGDDSEFMKAYRHKGRVSTLLDSVPTFAVMVENLGVRGAHKAALMDYEKWCAESGDRVTKKEKSGAGQGLHRDRRAAVLVSALASFASGLSLGLWMQDYCHT